MIVTVSKRGSILIPAPVRRALDIQPATRLRIQVDETNQQIILTPLTRAHVNRLRGKYKGKDLMKVLMSEKERAREL